MESLNIELIEPDCRMVFTRGLTGERHGEMLVQGYKVSIIQDDTSSGHLMYSIVTTGNNTILYS